MPCQGPNCPGDERSGQPTANQTVWNTIQQIDISPLLLAANPTDHAAAYASLLLATQAFNHATLIADRDSALSGKLYRLASIFGEEALVAGLKAAPKGTATVKANATFP